MSSHSQKSSTGQQNETLNQSQASSQSSNQQTEESEEVLPDISAEPSETASSYREDGKNIVEF